MKPTSPTPSSSTDRRLGREDADLLDLVLLPFGHQPDLHARPHAPSITRVRMITPRYGSYQESKISALSGASGSPSGGGSRATIASRISSTPMPFLGAGQDRVAGVEPDDLLDLPLGFVRLRARQVDLVDDRNDLEVVLDREVGVGQRLRFDALRRIDQQQRAFARRQRARHFVGEVDVARRVDQVQDVGLAVVRRVVQPDRVGLDRDAALALEVHVSRTCASISRACSAPVSSRKRSASVDLPWSMCAMMEKLRMKRWIHVAE